MVKKGGRKHSNECQFYITLANLQSFDKNFVAFGRIVEGFENIHTIQNMETYLQRPSRVIKISSCGEYVV
jgi:cyclophilin family peptidyl-prolyl cis-trans isomerase